MADVHSTFEAARRSVSGEIVAGVRLMARTVASALAVFQPKRLLVVLIRVYQRVLSSWTRPACRFVPSCSEYAAQSIEKYGAVKGSWKAFLRLLKCHPFSRGGYDPP